MLVLSRKKNESIVINDDITIVVVEIRGDKVRLGVEAPKEVPVHRREVFDAIHRNDSTGEKFARRGRRCQQQRTIASAPLPNCYLAGLLAVETAINAYPKTAALRDRTLPRRTAARQIFLPAAGGASQC